MPLEHLDIIVADVPREAELAGRQQGDHGDHGVDACHEEGLIPGEVGDGRVARSEVLQVFLF